MRLLTSQLINIFVLFAGAEGRVTLIHPAKNKMFAHLPVFKKAYISCLRVHPSNVNWLFCGADHGKIALIDTGLTGSSNYEISWQKIKLVSLFYLNVTQNC